MEQFEFDQQHPANDARPVSSDAKRLEHEFLAERFSLPREARGLDPEHSDGLFIFRWEDTDRRGLSRYTVMVFTDKQGLRPPRSRFVAPKPVLYRAYRSARLREQEVEDLLANVRRNNAAKVAAKAKARAALTESPNGGYKVGDVMYASWGYDQTNIDFYVVVGLRGSTQVVVQECGKTIVESSMGSDMVVPDTSHVCGEPQTIRVTADGTGHPDGHYARKYSGRPMHQTAWGYGH